MLLYMNEKQEAFGIYVVTNLSAFSHPEKSCDCLSKSLGSGH